MKYAVIVELQDGDNKIYRFVHSKDGDCKLYDDKISANNLCKEVQQQNKTHIYHVVSVNM